MKFTVTAKDLCLQYSLLYCSAAICCLGSMYEKLGRMMGRSYEETVTTLVRSMKSAESQTRLEIMTTLDKVITNNHYGVPLLLFLGLNDCFVRCAWSRNEEIFFLH